MTKPTVGVPYEASDVETIVPTYVGEQDGKWYVEFVYPGGTEQYRRLITYACEECGAAAVQCGVCWHCGKDEQP